MLPADARIRSSRDFGSVLKRGRRAARGGVVVHWAPAPHRTEDHSASPPSTPPAADANRTARAGFVVSKAVGNAVVRNKVKRRLRHAAAAELPHWPAGTDVVVRATPRAAERDFAGLRRDLTDAVQAARSGKGGGPRGRRGAP
ncbi:ribonuclease P protein component [Glycomyces sp. TRM65418]|uniref:ribonuclease P protein component n=1 Tax=Glycomyces sp. TRM65418 TaxID=2867006 RepID=UPI001CE6BB0D|nr:ribonuclease P protein component [Glycomyces sp. TRM65418]MCC3764134.1 ribonuclease P protein component [Glycomyces sp. TRM65418]QZD53820.1 ribonuclease P protein component [Glycomyces sp. TRM65418]